MRKKSERGSVSRGWRRTCSPRSLAKARTLVHKHCRARSTPAWLGCVAPVCCAGRRACEGACVGSVGHGTRAGTLSHRHSRGAFGGRRAARCLARLERCAPLSSDFWPREPLASERTPSRPVVTNLPLRLSAAARRLARWRPGRAATPSLRRPDQRRNGLRAVALSGGPGPSES